MTLSAREDAFPESEGGLPSWSPSLSTFWLSTFWLVGGDAGGAW
jgi:hypothetical protein